MIWDCCMLLNELDLIEIRLHELYPVVDRFVFVEAHERFDGCKKDLVLQDNITTRFIQFKDKILYISLDTLEGVGLEARESFQFNQIMQGLVEASDEDIIILSDADEIVKADVVQNLKFGSTPYRPVKQIMYMFYINYLWTLNWKGSVITTLKFLKDYCKTPRQARLNRHHGSFIGNGGWHFSQFGTLEDTILRRKNSFHYEGEQIDPLSIERERSRGQREYRYKGYRQMRSCTLVDINKETHPSYLVENLNKYQHLIGAEFQLA